MNKRNIKLIMELIFIFILPLIFIATTSEITIQREFETINTENLPTNETKTIKFNNSIIKYTKQEPYNTYSYNLENGWPSDFVFDLMSILNQLNSDQNIGYRYPIEDYLNDLGMGNNIFNYINGQYYLLTLENEYELEYKDNTNKWLYIALIKNGTSYYRYNNGQPIELYNIWINDVNTIENRDTSYDNYNYINFNSLYTQAQNISEQYYTSNYLTVAGNYPDNPFLPINYTITTNYETVNTIWGNIKNLLITNLELNDNVLLDLILCYTILWIIMFIIWHFIYGFFELIVHVIPSPFDKG